MRKGTNYGSQSYFASGYGNPLNTNKIKKYWAENKYITSAGYTLEGWFFVMSETSDYTNQYYYYDYNSPSNWIQQKYNDGCMITDIAKGDDMWFVVMSKPTHSLEQRLNVGSLSSLGTRISENWKEGYFITSAAYQGDGNWVIVMTKTSRFYDQGYFTRSSTSETMSELDSKFNDGYYPTIVEYGGGWYLGVYSKSYGIYKPEMKTAYHSNNIPSYIEEFWKDNYDVVYIGGGYVDEEKQATETTESNTNTSDALSNIANALNALGQAFSKIGGGTTVTTIQQGMNNTVGTSQTQTRNNTSTNKTPEKKKCTACAGSGKCSGSHRCRGTGKCDRCNGKGFDYTAGDMHKCGSCDGTGKCYFCGGKGTCKRCGGSGYSL